MAGRASELSQPNGRSEKRWSALAGATGCGVAIVVVLVVFARGPTTSLSGNTESCSPARIQNQSYYDPAQPKQSEERCIALVSPVYLAEERSLPPNRVLVFNSIFTLYHNGNGGTVVDSVNVAFTIYDSSGPYDCSGTSYGNFVVVEDPNGTAVVGSSYQSPMPCA